MFSMSQLHLSHTHDVPMWNACLCPALWDPVLDSGTAQVFCHSSLADIQENHTDNYSFPAVHYHFNLSP